MPPQPTPWLCVARSVLGLLEQEPDACKAVRRRTERWPKLVFDQQRLDARKANWAAADAA